MEHDRGIARSTNGLDRSGAELDADRISQQLRSETRWPGPHAVYRAVMVRSRSQVAEAEKSLERLFRLAANRKMYARQAATVGAVVARPGYALMRSIDEAGEISMGDLARASSMDPAAAGRQVRVLEEDGIVERVAGADDGRTVVVRLTDEGRAVLARIIDVRTSYLAKVLDGWPEEDRAELIRLVDRLVDGFRMVPFKPSPRQR